jgi:NAD(P)-dependent dehydrogenase (short-subunit alcohol dehydrogenase family)
MDVGRSVTDERTAIVTGGGSGIGLAISERLAADGMAVAIFDRDDAAAEAAAAKIEASGGRAIGVTVDVSERSQTPVRRAGRPEDIAAMCSFLVRDEAGYVTGQVLGVNGGRTT